MHRPTLTSTGPLLILGRLAQITVTRSLKPRRFFFEKSVGSPSTVRVHGSLLLVGLVATILGNACGGSAAALPKDEVPLLPVTVRRAALAKDFQVVREYQGQIEARRRSKVGFDLSGVLTGVAVDEGAEVKKGAVVAWLDTQRLTVRKRQLAAAVKEAETALALANSTLDRFATALERAAVSPQDVDEATRGRDAAAAALERTVAQLDGVEVDFSKSRLRAPYRAYVTQRLADEGEVVASGQPILELIEIDRPRVRVGVSLEVASQGKVSELGGVDAGEQAIFTVAERTVRARRLAVLPEQSGTTRTVDLLFELEEPLGALRVGQTARLRIPSRATGEAGISLPTSALTEASRGLWSCLVAVGSTAADAGVESSADDTDASVYTLERRVVEIVEVGSVDGVPRVTVRGGLNLGELVVMEGLHRLVPGQRVRLAHEDRPSGASNSVEGERGVAGSEQEVPTP